MTIKQLYDYLGNLIKEGKGGRKLLDEYDGAITEISCPEDMITEFEEDADGVRGGNIKN